MTSVTINKFQKQTYKSSDSLAAQITIQSSLEKLYLRKRVSCCSSPNIYRRV